jgi:hypothetical protein
MAVDPAFDFPFSGVTNCHFWPVLIVSLEATRIVHLNIFYSFYHTQYHLQYFNHRVIAFDRVRTIPLRSKKTNLTRGTPKSKNHNNFDVTLTYHSKLLHLSSVKLVKDEDQT